MDLSAPARWAVNTLALMSLTAKGTEDDLCQRERDYCIHGGLFFPSKTVVVNGDFHKVFYKSLLIEPHAAVGRKNK